MRGLECSTTLIFGYIPRTEFLSGETSMKRERIFATGTVFALLLPLSCGMSARAQSADSSAVFVGGTPIMRVRVASGGYSPAQRASHIQSRVNKFLGQGPIR